MPRPWLSLDQQEPIIAPITTHSFWARQGLAPLNTAGAWGTANLAVYVPIWLPKPVYSAPKTLIINGWFGGTIAGTVEMAIYNCDSEGKPGTKYATTGSQTVGAQGWNGWSCAKDILPGGLLYLALVCTNSTQTVYRLLQAGTTGLAQIMGGVFTQAAASPLPATATPSASFVDCAVPALALSWT